MSAITEKSPSPKAYAGVMVSSTFADIAGHRAEAIRILEERQLLPRVMEFDSSKTVDVIESSLQMVRESAAYVGVITHRYGQTPYCAERNPESLSITELEFNEAQKLGRPTLIFIMGEGHEGRRVDFEQDPGKQIKLDAFRERAKRALPRGTVDRVYATFNSRDEFSKQFNNAVTGLAELLQKPSRVKPLIRNTEIWSITAIEPKPDLYGRDKYLQQVVDGIRNKGIVLIGGGPGFGKTALAIASLYDASIEARFGARRLFVSYEAVSDTQSILSKCVESFGMQPSGNELSLLVQLEQAVAVEEAVVLLDNAETVFDSAGPEAERLLRLMAQIPNLFLVLTMRGAPPALSGAEVISDLSGLNKDAAKQAFLAASGASFEGDPYLDGLLDVLEGHVLSIQLVGAQANGLRSLEGIRALWEAEHAAILRRPHSEEARLTSVRASLALSLKGPILGGSPLAKRLLAVISYLPAGLDEDVVKNILGGLAMVNRTRALEASNILERLRLLERRLDRRLRMLTPLRESVKLDVPLNSNDRQRMIKHFLSLTALGSRAGTKRWGEVEAQLDVDAANLDVICEIALKCEPFKPMTGEAIQGLSKYYRFTRRPEIQSVKKAADLYYSKGKYLWAGALYSDLAIFEMEKYEFESAGSYIDLTLNAALLCRNRTMEAYANRSKSNIFEKNSNRASAEKYQKRAWDLFCQDNNLIGQAQCLMTIGQIEMWGEDTSAAVEYIERAKAIAEDVGEVLTEAHCLSLLAALIKDKEEEYLQAAAAIYEEVGAHASLSARIRELSIKRIGEGKLSEAVSLLENSILIARRRSSIEDEAASLIQLGRAKWCLGEVVVGREKIAAGFRLWLKLMSATDPTRRGWESLRDALLADNPETLRAHMAVARSEWSGLGRYDFIRYWIEETLETHLAFLEKGPTSAP